MSRRKFSVGTKHIFGEATHLGVRASTGKQITPQGMPEALPVSSVQGFAIGLRSAIKCPCHLLDPASDTKVPNTHFTQASIHVVKRRIEEGLSKSTPLVAFALQASDQQENMQNDHVEATVDGIGDTPVGIESRPSRLADRNVIKTRDNFVVVRSTLVAETKKACQKGVQHATHRTGSGPGIATCTVPPSRIISCAEERDIA